MNGTERSWPNVVRILNETKGTVVAERASVARTIWDRGRGLMLRTALEPGAGLVIDPCSSIHSMWMRFPIDVLYLDRDDAVVLVDAAMRPWHIGPLFAGGRVVVELPEGTAALSRTEAGDRLRYEAAD